LRYTPDARDKQGISRSPFFDQIVLIKPVGELQVQSSVYYAMLRYLTAFEGAHSTLTRNLGVHFPFAEMFKHTSYPYDGLDNRESDMDYRKALVGTLPSHPVIKLPFGDLSGSSFTNSIILVDEAQNFTPHQLRIILKQIGRGSKMIIMGDHKQVNKSLGCTEKINGLTHAVDHYLGKPYVASIYLNGHWRGPASKNAREMR